MLNKILLILFLVLLAGSVYSANATWDIQASGGDQTSLMAAILNDTSVSAGDTLFIICHNVFDSVTITSPLSWDNWTITGTVYIYPHDSIRWNGIPTDAKCVWAFDDAFIIDDSGEIIIEGFQLRSADDGFLQPPVDAENYNITFKECSFTQTSGTTTNFYDANATVAFKWKFINCYWYNWLTTVFLMGTDAIDWEIYFYNCTFFENTRAFYLRGTGSSVAYFMNSLFLKSTTASIQDGATSNPTVNYCVDDDGTINAWGGTGNLVSKNVILCDTANNNAMLSPLDTICIGTGLDLYDSVTTIDVARHPRSDDYDIGYSQAPVEGYYEIDPADLMFFQIQSGLGANRFYGKSTTAQIGVNKPGFGDWESNIIFWIYNFNDSLADYILDDVNLNQKIDSVVCSLYVASTDFYTTPSNIDTVMNVYLLDTTNDVGEAGTGGLSVECGTSWNQEEEAGGGGTCSDVNWGTAGGDLVNVSRFTETMLFTKAMGDGGSGWIANTYDSTSDLTVLFEDIADTTLNWIDESDRSGTVNATVGGLLIQYNSSSFTGWWSISSDDASSNTPKFQYWGKSLGGWTAHSVSTETTILGKHGKNKHGGILP